MTERFQEKVVGTVALEKEKKEPETNSGCKPWSRYPATTLAITTTTRSSAKVKLSLDPYAKSLAAWNSDLAKTDAAHKVAKTAFVDPAGI